MKPELTAIAILSAGLTLANPLSFPTYEQRVTLTFASEQDAARATCRIASLPDGAEISFGTRWDDTSSKNVPKAEMLNTIGAKASFYLVSGNTPERRNSAGALGRRLRDLGHAVGNHTQLHSYILQFSPNGFFREVLLARMALETGVDRTLNSYANPYGWHRNPAEPEQMSLYARLLVDTGHYVSGDNPMDEFNLPRTLWYPAHRFSADDRTPSVQKFRAQSAAYLKRALSEAETPRLTLGTHAWCDAAGNEIQRQEIQRLCDGRNWVQQSDWEYGAFRYEALNDTVAKAGVSGSQATFVITRIRPSALAADVPLSLCIDPAPAEGLARGPHGTWKLPHADGLPIVTRVDTAGADGRSVKFEGLRLTVGVNVKNDEGEILLENNGPRPLADGWLVFHSAPVWKRHRHVVPLPTLQPGASARRTFALGERDRADYSEDAVFVAASADFTLEGRACRLWAAGECAGEGLPFPTPRDAALASGFLAEPLDDATLAAAAVPGAPLPTVTEWGNRVPKNGHFVWYLLDASAPTPKDVVQSKAPRTRYFVWDFAAEKDGVTCFRSNVRDGGWYAGGRSGVFGRDGVAEVPVRAGKNRIIVRETRVYSKSTPFLTLRREAP